MCVSEHFILLYKVKSISIFMLYQSGHEAKSLDQYDYLSNRNIRLLQHLEGSYL